MKKTLILPFVLFLTFNLKAQLPEKDGKVLFEQVDSFPGISKNEIYSKCKVWLVNAFVSSKDVIQLDDKENGTIIAKGYFDYYTMLSRYHCYFTLRIDIKDNKARIQIYDFNSEFIGSISSTITGEQMQKHPGSHKAHIKAINEHASTLMLRFKQSIYKTESKDF